MNIVEQIGIETNTSDLAYSAMQSVKAYGGQLLIPDLVGLSSVSVNISKNVQIIRSAGSLAELTGLQAFLNFLSANNAAISDPSEVWKYSTFITYIADSRDVGALNLSGSANVLILPDATNIWQSATYTLTTFSGECGAYARLYAATQQLLTPSTNTNARFYNVFFTPQSGSGHVTDLWTLDGQTWHVSNYMNEVTGTNPFDLLAYTWQTLQQQSLNNTAITIVDNIYYDPSLSQKEFLNVVFSRTFEYLQANNYLDNQSVTAVNYAQSTEYSAYYKQVSGQNLFDIISYSPSSSSSSSTQTSSQGFAMSSSEWQSYLPYIVIGGIALILLSQM